MLDYKDDNLDSDDEIAQRDNLHLRQLQEQNHDSEEEYVKPDQKEIQLQKDLRWTHLKLKGCEIREDIANYASQLQT